MGLEQPRRTTLLLRLFDHMWWADALVAEALERADGAPARAVEVYAHVLGAELVWLDRIQQLEQSVAVWPEADLAVCRRLVKGARERYEGLSQGPFRARPAPYRALPEQRGAGIRYPVGRHSAACRSPWRVSSRPRRAPVARCWGGTP